ncbi:hypothetical protein KGF56_001715 [Candida oxycetoniae]|uniref:CobW/HypB/UreG nucleotide-binding domain-containing protein n=1 Tax=Candida oxycetoniae TaxID=497107 RepID=A0AAI9WYT3_9ASCO|nr:uncharacterized protein KGF56_001715 [Candida oxycetoniae]KAI3405468.2 hypothetical protein KGF56_001715 [Candida oxycetoniae]
MDEEIPELVTELPENGEIKTERYIAEKFVPFSSTPTPLRNQIPVTIVTGYLGSGKSTLLKQIGLKSNKRLAIILNEFGDSSVVEKSVRIEDQNNSIEEWLDIGNGCLCCTVKDNGVAAIENLIERSKDKIDYILLETTGIADPGPIANMFWLDRGLASNIYVDGVVTVVDAGNIVKSLDDVNSQEKPLDITAAHLQIALADVVLLNKSDKVRDLETVTLRIQSINQTCPIYPTKFGDIETSKILDLHAFDANAKLVENNAKLVENNAKLVENNAKLVENNAKLVENNAKLVENNATFHGDKVITVTLDFPFFKEVSDFDKMEKFLQKILWENKANGKPIEILRLKGLLICKDDVRVVQGVRETYEIIENGVLLDNVDQNKLVLIGKDLNSDDLKLELEHFI